MGQILSKKPRRLEYSQETRTALSLKTTRLDYIIEHNGIIHTYPAPSWVQPSVKTLVSPEAYLVRPMRMRTKWRIKFPVATKKLTHNIESEIKGSIDGQRRKMNDRAQEPRKFRLWIEAGMRTGHSQLIMYRWIFIHQLEFWLRCHRLRSLILSINQSINHPHQLSGDKPPFISWRSLIYFSRINWRHTRSKKRDRRKSDRLSSPIRDAHPSFSQPKLPDHRNNFPDPYLANFSRKTKGVERLFRPVLHVCTWVPVRREPAR